ncbi:phytanoyl-CoA dioxygenase family protein [Cupriavidus metallidurans]|uniref:phytanoyl-CoA dioxygenase family protein n=1 Tax=Cupriavidus metallidurans TaxID=119219 RepID=UPI0016474363|nr:phytanoyl-CoA dioxygenase family protein [Cupriavidus metallidurans]
MSSGRVESYGVLRQRQCTSRYETVAEEVRERGYAILDDVCSEADLATLSEAFENVRARYVGAYGEVRLRAIDEYHTIRAMLTHGENAFVKLALNEHLMTTLKLLIDGRFVLNQQNGVINPSREKYNQGKWHRDLPYQHFVSSRPLAINALFCIDDFTPENGATHVLPGSHKSEELGSDAYVERNKVQIAAKAGSFIVLDCMLYHTGGENRSDLPRRAVNHVFTIPFFKQQIQLPNNLDGSSLSPEARDLFGFNYVEPASIEEYLASRGQKLTR